MASLRFVSVWFILILLLGIILEKFEDRKEKPMLFIAHDNSESILMTKDSSFYKKKYLEELQSMSDELSNDFDVVEYSFSDKITDGLKSDYSGKLTDVSNVFNQIFDQYSNRNIGGIILSTDGIYNNGSNPIYALERRSFLPVFTIGLGDTALVRDVKIDLVQHNEIAFLGNEFPVEVSFSQSKCIGEKVKVGIYENDKLLKEKEFEFLKNEEQQKMLFNLNASSLGFRKFTIKISELDNEFNKDNNTANFYIEIIDGRQKILIAKTGSHPDIGAMRFVIDNNKNYDVDVLDVSEVKSVGAYDLVIAHNYNGQNNVLSDAIQNGTVPFLFILGEKADMRKLQNMKIGFSGSGSDTEELGFAINPGFKEIVLSPKTIQLLSAAPPLTGPFGSYNFSSALDVWAYRKVGNIQLDQPLIYFTNKGGNRQGVITGEGIWRWRLYDQMKNGSTLSFEEFISKLITYLAIKENKDPFRVNLLNEYAENENIIVGAQLYNKSFDLINEPEVEFILTNSEDKNFESHFLQVNDVYELDLGRLNEGIYNWTAKTQFQGVNYEKNGTFLVKQIKLELLNNQADHQLLKSLSANSGGEFYSPKELSRLKADINERDDMVTVVYQEKSFDDIIDYWWLFIFIFLLMSVEWFMRKYLGAY